MSFRAQVTSQPLDLPRSALQAPVLGRSDFAALPDGATPTCPVSGHVAMVDSCLNRHLDVQLHAARAQIVSLSARDGIEATSTPVNLGFRCTCRCWHLNNNGAPG